MFYFYFYFKISRNYLTISKLPEIVSIIKKKSLSDLVIVKIFLVILHAYKNFFTSTKILTVRLMWWLIKWGKVFSYGITLFKGVILWTNNISCASNNLLIWKFGNNPSLIIYSSSFLFWKFGNYPSLIISFSSFLFSFFMQHFFFFVFTFILVRGTPSLLCLLWPRCISYGDLSISGGCSNDWCDG